MDGILAERENMMTKDEALATDRFHYGECVRTVGPRGGVTVKIEEWRRNGANKLWKRDQTRFRIPVKWGLKCYDEINPGNVDRFHSAKDCPLND